MAFIEPHSDKPNITCLLSLICFNIICFDFLQDVLTTFDFLTDVSPDNDLESSESGVIRPPPRKAASPPPIPPKPASIRSNKKPAIIEQRWAS